LSNRSASPIRVAIHGAAGRVGQRLVALAAADPQLQLVAALDRPDHPRQGDDVGLVAGIGAINVPLSSCLNGDLDVLIDFSQPAACEAIVRECLTRRIPAAVATTGLSKEQIQVLHTASRQIAVLWSPNMSLAVNLTMKLAQVAAAALKPHDADVEILERHHRFKEDAPSGTALRFGEIIAGVMGQTTHRHGRQGRPGRRPHDEIAYHAIRTGDNPGEHTIIFGMLGETIELTVRASNRDCYALGALAAAKFLVDKPAGWYAMGDVLGIS
jgi:4-hydroxy-tetrahydrodipicolinate reductase